MAPDQFSELNLTELKIKNQVKKLKKVNHRFSFSLVIFKDMY